MSGKFDFAATVPGYAAMKARVEERRARGDSSPQVPSCSTCKDQRLLSAPLRPCPRCSPQQELRRHMRRLYVQWLHQSSDFYYSCRTILQSWPPEQCAHQTDCTWEQALRAYDNSFPEPIETDNDPLPSARPPSDLIDFPCSPAYASHFASQGLTRDYPPEWYEARRAERQQRLEAARAALEKVDPAFLTYPEPPGIDLPPGARPYEVNQALAQDNQRLRRERAQQKRHNERLEADLAALKKHLKVETQRPEKSSLY